MWLKAKPGTELRGPNLTKNAGDEWDEENATLAAALLKAGVVEPLEAPVERGAEQVEAEKAVEKPPRPRRKRKTKRVSGED